MPSNPQRHCVFVEKTKSKTKAKKENKNGDQRMSKPNRLNSAGSGHVGPHRTMREREVPSGAVRALQKAFVGTNVVGEGPSMRPLEKLRLSNTALAEPRNDPRFKDVFTSHPANSGRFPESPKRTKTKKKK
jgi:hypothetical protein